MCERVDDNAADHIGAIGGISRVWENGTLVYDIRPQHEANTTLGTIAETDEDYANRLTASAAYAEGFTLHLGDELQTADSTIEAVEGMGNVPAFRGLAYIVFPNRNLTIAQGLRHPNFQFEVFESGTGNCTNQTLYSNSVLYRWGGGSTQNPVHPSNTNSFAVQAFDDLLVTTGGKGYLDYAYFSHPFASADDLLATLTPYYKVPFEYIGYSSFDALLGGNNEVQQTSGTGSGVPTPSDYLSVQPHTVSIYYNFKQPEHGFFTNYQRFNALIPYAYPNEPPQFATFHDSDGSNGRLVSTLGYTWPSSVGLFPPWPAPYPNGGENTFTNWPYHFYLYDVSVTVTRSPSAPLSLCAGLTQSILVPGYAVRTDGRLIKCNAWSVVPGPYTNWKTMSVYGANKTTNSYPWNPTLRSTDPNYNNATFWTNAYNGLVGEGKMPAGLVYGTDYPVTPTTVYSIDQTICEGNGGLAKVSDIVAAICARAGLTQIDVSDLTAYTVPGYSVSSICDAVSVISPLRSVAFFDCIESGSVMRFTGRGKPLVATLTADDFGCFDGSNNSVPPAVTTVRADETTLPRSIRLHYKAVSRDYQDGEANSPFRLTTTAVDDQDVSLPLCLGDTQAAHAVEILWSDAWAAQNSHELSVDQAWSELEPGDCIGVPIDGVIQRLRIVSDSNAAAILRKLSCVRDDEGSYVSFAVAHPPQAQPQTLKRIAPTSAEFLDLPCLRDADSDPGFYVATQRVTGAGNSWKGATVYKSIDGGATFTPQFSALVEATIGTLISALPVSEAHTWDTTTVIDVAVASSAFTFESRTDAAVLAGANGAAVGDDGRWEIIQYANATKISDTHWQLSRLLRGRRGTEHNIGRSHINDRLVVISTGDVGRVVLQTTEIGASRLYKVVSIGASFSSGTDTPFSGHAEALVPFSPTALSAVQETSDGILISWLRRSRLGRTLMSGVDIPLGETAASYQVDILDSASPDSPEVVLRTLTVTTEFALYSGAQQTADFGHTLPSGSQLKVAVYQMSSVVGRGTPAIATLTVG